ncbi:MAG TPA: 30S ribosomal protein S1 [Bacteroidota bacterium]|nr:30S ribosomal protein S1 [Bacteroidota bacterium]
MAGSRRDESRQEQNMVVIPEKFGSGRKVVAQLEDVSYSKTEYDEMVLLYDQTFGKVQEGQIVKGRVVAINDNGVAVDIGFKSEGLIPLTEFPNLDQIKPGEDIEVFLESVENRDGQLVLSRKRADFMRTWERITRAYDTGEVLQGKITRRIKGGLVVDLMGIDAFLPGSQIDIKPVRDFDQFIGKVMELRVVKMKHPDENVVVSHKSLVEEEISEQRNAILSRLEKGQVLEGTVKAITDFGVFVDLGGVDGLIHITDLSWGRVNHPSEIVKLDQTINVVVLDFDEVKKRISLGLKQLQPHPWENIDVRYPIGTKVNGKVVSLADYGAFIEIEKGIEGLIHISEMSWTQHIKHPSQIVSMGQKIDAIILSLDKDNKKISLGMKQLEPDPWLNLLQRYPIGSRHTGTVRNLTAFGAFVELEEGFDGLIHISDLSWTKKIRHPGEIVKKGEKIDVVILGVDVEQRRISLGHKQVKDNPWEAFDKTYQVGTEVEVKIVRIIEKGVIVELPLGVDAFIPVSHLSTTQIKKIEDTFHVGDSLMTQVIEFDKENKKIVLSVVEYLKGKDQKIIDDYAAQHKLPKMTMKDIATVSGTPEEGTEAPAEPAASDFMQ